MLNFQYKGISQGKYVEGEIEALNNSEAAYKLKEQKVIITKLIEAKKKKVEKEKKPACDVLANGINANDRSMITGISSINSGINNDINVSQIVE